MITLIRLLPTKFVSQCNVIAYECSNSNGVGIIGRSLMPLAGKETGWEKLLKHLLRSVQQVNYTTPFSFIFATIPLLNCCANLRVLPGFDVRDCAE